MVQQIESSSRSSTALPPAAALLPDGGRAGSAKPASANRDERWHSPAEARTVARGFCGITARTCDRKDQAVAMTIEHDICHLLLASRTARDTCCSTHEVRLDGDNYLARRRERRLLRQPPTNEADDESVRVSRWKRVPWRLDSVVAVPGLSSDRASAVGGLFEARDRSPRHPVVGEHASTDVVFDDFEDVVRVAAANVFTAENRKDVPDVGIAPRERGCVPIVCLRKGRPIPLSTIPMAPTSGSASTVGVPP